MKENLKITTSKEDFDYWKSRPYVKDDIRSSIESANLLFVPFENFREGTGHVFIQGTMNLYQMFKENAPEELIPELCMTDEEYQEIELNNSYTDIGVFIATDVILPTALTLIYDFLKARFSKPEKTDIVKLEVLEQDGNGRVRSIKYEGPLEGLRPSMTKAIEIPFEEVMDEESD